jgi:glycosyltransferase 2 family protein
MKKRQLITAAGFLISLILLYLSLKDIRFQEILGTLRKADYRLVPVPLFFILFSVTLCAFRWSRIIGTGIRFPETFVALLIGLFINNVLPARMGEIARGYVLSRKKGLSLTYSLSTVFLDRFFDLAGLLILTFLFFPRHSLPSAVSQGIYALIILLIVCIALIIILGREKIAGKVADRLMRTGKPVFARLARRIIEVQENLQRINSFFNLAYLVLISCVTWFSMSVALYFVTLMLGVSVSFAAIPFVCALLNMGLTMPSSPGYVGIYQFLLVYLLSIFGVPKYEGFTVSVLYHAAWYIPYNILGFVFLLKEHLKIKELQKLEEEEDEKR